MIRLEFSEQETDYVYRLLMSRPMVEVESLVNRIRRQVQAGDMAPMAQEAPQTALGAPNGHGADSDLPALP